MDNMKIGTKLFLSYLFLVFIILSISGISFRFISQHYLLSEARESLRKDAAIISQMLEQETLTSETIRGKLLNRKKVTFVEHSLRAKIIVRNSNQKIMYTNLDTTSLNLLKDAKRGKTEFISVRVPIYSKAGDMKGQVVLVTKVEDIQELNGLLKKSQRWSFVISSLIALLICIIFQRKITDPIKKLTNHMTMFTLRGENRRLSIKTNDEVKELADTFEALTKKLKKYDEQQKVFFQNASHELKTPLMAIQGNAEAILDGVVRGVEVNESLSIIINESQRLKKLVEQISFLSKLENVEETFHFSFIKNSHLIKASIESVETLAQQKGIEIIVENLVEKTIRGDSDKLKQAFINVLGNAIRYAESAITINSNLQTENLIIEFRDDGEGFKPGEEEKVFERFYSGESNGSGIGLAITKAIIEGHGGEMMAEQNHPNGAIFRMLIPIK